MALRAILDPQYGVYDNIVYRCTVKWFKSSVSMSNLTYKPVRELQRMGEERGGNNTKRGEYHGAMFGTA
jgi:hypothetical protein